jgi:L-ascorbate metabolism protein UlaG (beta-lactamase superfamily)
MARTCEFFLFGSTVKVFYSTPIFGKPPFVKTFVDVPSPLENIKKVDYVLLSHDHRDHTDEESIRQIAGKFPEANFTVVCEWKNFCAIG